MASVILLFMGVILFGSFVMYREVRSDGCQPAGGGDDEACENTGAEIFSAMLGILFAGQSLSQIGSSLEKFTDARVAAAEALQVMSRVEGSPAQVFTKPQQPQTEHAASLPLDRTVASSASGPAGVTTEQL